jgi:recombinational DNA repair protein RecT
MAKQTLKDVLPNLAPKEIASNELVRNQFIETYKKIHDSSDSEAEAFYEKEKSYYIMALNDEKSRLTTCTNLSLYSSFMECAIQGLSTKKQGQAEAYYECKGIKRIIDKKETWVNTCFFVVMAYGELALRKRYGQILHASNPIIVYETDTFKPKTNEDGDLIIHYEQSDKKSNKIKACFTILHLPGGIRDYKWLDKDDVERLRKKSAKMLRNDKGNALYSSGIDGQIDEDFLRAKCLKHAFKTLPRMKYDLSNVKFEPESVEEDDDIVDGTNSDFTEKKPEKQQESKEKDGNLFGDMEDDSPFK